ncbi:MAG TPA: hypothetical protein DCM71_29075 [Runella sp.]|nr:hypothetical protein [Runella sp.]
MILQAGKYAFLYEQGSIRQLKHQGKEVVRMIYFALRDHNWGTFDKVIFDEVVQKEGTSFQIHYKCNHVDETSTPIFEWEVAINGAYDGTISFEISGKALTDVWSNRAGFCVLHPIKGIANQPVSLLHEDGASSTSIFPQYISPEDPFLMIRSMTWQVAGGAAYQMDFEGDTFETEDQRNWGDASFKTFCTPLSKPFPVLHKKGNTVFQRITLQPPIENPTLEIKPEEAVLPPKATAYQLGIGASVESIELTKEAIDQLKKLQLTHYRIDLTLPSASWITEFSTHCENAFDLGLPLEVALTIGEEEEKNLEEFVFICQQNRLNISGVLLFSTNEVTTPQRIIDLIPTLKNQLPNVKFGVGTNYNFTELNRNRFEAKEADFVTFSYHPQAHAFDNLTILENAETLEYQVESAEHLYDKPVHINFISLRARANPYASSPADVQISLSKQIDPRQSTGFAKDWLSVIFGSLSASRVSSVTLLRTVGQLGILSLEGNPYPVFKAFPKKNSSSD